jgi:hypothetical protein
LPPAAFVATNPKTKKKKTLTTDYTDFHRLSEKKEPEFLTADYADYADYKRKKEFGFQTPERFFRGACKLQVPFWKSA